MINIKYKKYLKYLSWEYKVDGYKSVELHAKYENGKLFDIDTNVEIKLRNGSYLIIDTDEYSLLEIEDIEINTVKNEEVIAQKGEEFIFGFISKKDNVEVNCFLCKLRLNENLKMTWKGKKLGKLLSCECDIIEIENQYGPVKDFKIISAHSLNSAFTLASIKYRPDTSSHTCNAFKIFIGRDSVPLDNRRIDLMNKIKNQNNQSIDRTDSLFK